MNLMEDLKAYVDGELSPERQSEIESAMEQDERLRQELEEIRVLSRLIGDCVVEPEPAGLERTLVLLEARKTKPFLTRLFTEPKRFGWVYAMAAFVLVAAIFPNVVNNSRADESAVAMDTATAATSKGVASSPSVDRQDRAEAPAEDAKSVYGYVGSSTERQDPSLAEGGLNGAPEMSLKRPSRTGFSGKISAGASAPSASGGVGVTGTTPGTPAPESNQAPGRVKKKGEMFRPFLVRTSEIALRVESVQKAQTEAENVAKSFGGYVEDSSGSAYQENAPTAQLTLRIPEPRFQQALLRLRSLGTVIASSVTGTDVTAEVADSEARLRVMRAEEESYVNMLKDSHKVTDSLEIKDRLSQVRQQIESLDAQRKSLRNQATYSTITLSLSQTAEVKAPPKVVKPTWFDRAWGGATERASGLGKWLAEVGMNLLVLSPIWLPVVVGLWWLGRRGSKMRG
jgi:hypothetical protein